MTKRIEIPITADNRTTQAFNSVKQGLSNLEGNLSKVSKGFGLLGVVASGAVLGKFINDSIQASEEISKFSVILGESTEDITALQYAIQQTANITKEELNDALTDMRERIAEAAEGSGDAAGALQRLGLDGKKLKELSLQDQFFAIADAMKEMKNAGDRVLTIRELISDSGTPLLAALEKGSEELITFTREAGRMGVVVDQESTEKIREFKVQIETLGSIATNIGIEISAVLLPPLTSFLGLIQDLSRGLRDLGVKLGLFERNLQYMTREELQKAIEETENRIDALLSVPGGKMRGGGVATRITTLREELELLKQEADERIPEIVITPRKLPLDNYQIDSGELDEDMEKFREANRIFEYSKDDADRYLDKIREIKEALSSGFLVGGEETANKAIQKATDEFMERQKQQASEYEKLWMSTADTFAGGMGDAVAAVISKQMTAKEAMRSVLADVTSQIISGMVAIFIKEKVLAVARKAFSSATGEATATEAAAAAGAWAPAAALASLATQGANAFPAAAALTGTVALSQGLAVAGIADGGLDFAKNHGTYILERGEGVIKRADNERIPALLNRLDHGGASSSINFNVSIQALDTQSATEQLDNYLRQQEKTIVSMVQQSYTRRGKTGGPLK